MRIIAKMNKSITTGIVHVPKANFTLGNTRSKIAKIINNMAANANVTIGVILGAN